jgi:hypothetical protein
MRTFPTLLAFTCSAAVMSVLLCGAREAGAQVSDAERAGARELFKEGDQLQRAGHFAEALDKFQRAQQVFAAPTNVLRIAECDAALGRLVESAEAYREVLRSPLPAGSPPAFQAAVDQAKAELAQVEPRVPRVVVQVQPASVQNPQMQIDGQNVSGALLGEPIPLDAGTHKIAVLAPGYAATEQQVDLKEHDSKTVALTLNPSPEAAATSSATPPPPPVLGATPPAPPPIVAPDLGPSEPLRSRVGLLFGLHLGFEGASGKVPAPNTDVAVDSSNVAGGGLAFGLDGGLRFARHWYVGLTLDHAGLSGGNATDLQAAGVDHATSNTTQLGLIFALIVNPDRASFYGEIGLAERWFDVHETAMQGTAPPPQGLDHLYSGPEFVLGLGIWIPAGRSFRLLPKFTLGLGGLDGVKSSDSSSTYSAGAVFGMLGVAGFYNVDL